MLTQEIKSKALQLGFTSCGVIPAAAFDEYEDYLNERVKSFPESLELYEPLYGSIQPPAAGKSIIVCTRRYNRYKVPEGLNGIIAKVYLFDGRLPYAHENRAKEEFETFLKTLGLSIIKCDVPARWAAVKAGLAKFRLNNFVYSPEHGSYFWIDTWVVDKELDYGIPTENSFLSPCGDCRKCIQACPTKALSGDLSMDRGKCVAQLSFHTAELPSESLRPQMGRWLYGCDICQDVCPFNQNKFNETEEFPLLAELEGRLSLESILEMDEETYIDIIHPRFWYISKDSLWIWQCNALRCMINAGDEKYHSLIKGCLHHRDSRVREMALWGCLRLGIDTGEN